jgi:hypothetical protein
LLSAIETNKIDFKLLQNSELPRRVLPNSYDLSAYDCAILDPLGLSADSRDSKTGTISLCKECKDSLIGKKPKMPKFALANWLYYGYNQLPETVKTAFDNASLFEKALICRGRASRITFRYCDNKNSVEYGKSAATSQKYSKGNVMVMPQDGLNLSSSLPPSSDLVRDTMSVIFIGASRTLSNENIRKLSPILVQKSRVKTMIEFLTQNNPKYSPSDNFSGLDPQNLDALFPSEGVNDNESTPASVKIAHLDSSSEQGEFEVTADYTNRNDVDPQETVTDDPSNLLMENVGYTNGDTSPHNYTQMKLRAIEHCVSGRHFLQSCSGSSPISDFENPHLLS